MIDTGVTLVTLSEKLKACGAKSVTVCASHGLFTSDAMSLVQNSSVDQVLVTDTLPLPPNASSKVKQMSVARLLARVIETEHLRNKSSEEIYDIQ